MGPDARRSSVFFADGTDEQIAATIEQAIDDMPHMRIVSVTPAAWDRNGGFATRYMVVAQLREDYT